MGKLAYTTPVMSEEVFEADEYVAACWKVACARSGTDDFDEKVLGKDVTHKLYDGNKGCGYADNQWIEENGDGTYSMTERNTVNQGNLTCIMTNSEWNNPTTTISSVKGGDKLYWITNANDGSNRTWHHYGTVETNGNHS